MNNDDLQSGKYSLFDSHINHTEILDENRNIIEMGFDIEVDVQFKAKQDSKIIITAIGFDTQRPQTYTENGIITKTQSAWDFVDAWSDYKQMPIYTINSNVKSIPRMFAPVEVSLKAGEEAWLSQYIDNYSTVAFLKSVHILSDFEIIEGSVDVNIAALKHNGKLRDRNHHNNNAKQGIYYRDKQYKGVADTLPAVNANLHYTIDNTVLPGTLLPVKVYNQYNLNGNVVTRWFTNINPQEDIWSRNSAAESDMLSFKYYDEDKLKYYRSDIPKESRNALWIFDVFHSDTKESPIGIPNYKLSTSMDNLGNGCNLGNYGVSTNYNITINNTGSKKRYFNYNLNTSSTNLVVLKDSNGAVVNDLAVRKKAIGKKVEDTMASIELPPNTATTFTIEVTLPPNYPGGMENSFEISDTKYENEFYDTNMTQIKEPYPFTGKEYIKWYDGKLYFSSDCENWTQKKISNEVAKIFEGHWNNYEIKYLDGVYAVRWNAYDAAPYFHKDVLNFCNRVYYFDDSFNLITTHYFEGYPSDIFFKNGKIITMVNERQFSTTLPALEKTITVKLDNQYIDFDVNPIIEDGRTLVPIRAVFEGMGATVDWTEETRTAKITKKNQCIEFTIDSDIAMVNQTEKLLDVPPRQHNFRTLIPIRFISETLGYKVDWDSLTKTITVSNNIF